MAYSRLNNIQFSQMLRDGGQGHHIAAGERTFRVDGKLGI